ncbi:hypothetical protein COL30_20860 [Bacillus pseudomycoides]|uniref:Uncharacterized protein n=1 Tax=Bacillus pseudomycoides TaxID=64104 RepID=A0A2B4N403_9BACI|nr:hypothetical protein CON79_21800 [Bacillus pseudomycoides]PEA82922.1 hypothetical protein CON99_14350 [Bacillus pseudomycoides]PED04990.1 hypothetical protein COO19_29180 [Bacillus pseudomycoides]PED70416.1 hypothetical protein CON97_19675 [Bacillus pseudomycoides]PEI40047.1 hypothetical protein CN620_17180 [Bacillus pseudomycoides]
MPKFRCKGSSFSFIFRHSRFSSNILSEGTWNFNHMHNKPLIFLVFLYPIVYQISHIFVSRNNS